MTMEISNVICQNKKKKMMEISNIFFKIILLSSR